MNIQDGSSRRTSPGYPAYPQTVEAQRDWDDDDTIDLRAIFYMLWRGRWLLAVCVAIAVAAALVVVSSWEPRYLATAKVLFNPNERRVVDVESVVQTDSSSAYVANQIEILRSTALMERVVDELNLPSVRPEPTPAGQEEAAAGSDTASPAPTTASSDQSDFDRRIAQVIPVPDFLEGPLTDLGVLPAPPQPLSAEERARRQRLARIAGLRNNLLIDQVQGSRVIVLGYRSTNPRFAANVVNTVAEQYIVDQLEAKLEATRSATEWLSSRVDELRARVQTAEEEVEAARAELVESSGQGLEVLRSQLNARSQDLAQLRNAISEAEARQDRIEEALSEERDFGTVAEFRGSGVIQGYRSTETELLSRQATLEESVGPDHPARQRLRARLEEVRGNIRDEARRIAVSFQDELEALREREQAVLAEMRDLESRILEQSKAQLEVRQLEREAQASRSLYETFLSRLKETNAQQDLQTADARILSPAEVPTMPQSTSEKRTVVLAGMGGLMLGIGLLFLLEHLNNTFRGRDELEQKTGLRVLATLPLVGRRMRPSRVIAYWRNKPHSALGETVRNMRTSIMRTDLDSPPKVVMMTSSVPQEGKSTSTLLLALTSARLGKRVIIVDCDLRKPALARLLDADEEDLPGLEAVLESECSINDAIRVDDASGLHLLMTGSRRSEADLNAADLLSTDAFANLVHVLSENYDLVILDTPPALVVSDPRIIAGHADAVVYAVRWDSTARGAVMEGLKELQSVGAPIAGLVLTMIDETKAVRYGESGYSYYSRKYSRYYVN